ncbi:DUF4381 family protein [Longibacter salinarum]|uniref:DUF4381 family protein n=1 Tax=Longibacter salinarum TaxID=1850348 RepID=UPI00117CC7F3|nr:DUF4381 family protein [Longibacter salinarum]
MRLFLVLLLFSLTVGVDAQAQQIPARLDAYVTADSVAVGQRFTLVVMAEHGFAVDVQFPEQDAGPLIFGDVQVVEPRQTGERYLGADAPGQRVDSARYTVTTFALDSARVPTLPVRVITSGGDTLVGATPPVSIPVYATVPSDENQLRGLTPLASFPEPRWPWVLLAVAVISLVGVLAYLWWSRNDDTEEEPVVEEVEPETSPYERITEDLRELDRLDVTEPGNAKRFYVRLSESLRRYLAARLGMQTMERTTREVVEILEQRTDVPPVVTSRVRAVLELADLVKFSNARASVDDSETALQEAHNVVDIVESHHVEKASASPPPAGRSVNAG